MSHYVGTQTSPRHKIKFKHLPTRKSNSKGGSSRPYEIYEYGQILDCVYEMADMISNGNCVSVESAIEQVLKDENWSVLPTHKNLIADMLKA